MFAAKLLAVAHCSVHRDSDLWNFGVLLASRPTNLGPTISRLAAQSLRLYAVGSDTGHLVLLWNPQASDFTSGTRSGHS